MTYNMYSINCRDGILCTHFIKMQQILDSYDLRFLQDKVDLGLLCWSHCDTIIHNQPWIQTFSKENQIVLKINLAIAATFLLESLVKDARICDTIIHNQPWIQTFSEENQIVLKINFAIAAIFLLESSVENASNLV